MFHRFAMKGVGEIEPLRPLCHNQGQNYCINYFIKAYATFMHTFQEYNTKYNSS